MAYWQICNGGVAQWESIRLQIERSLVRTRVSPHVLIRMIMKPMRCQNEENIHCISSLDGGDKSRLFTRRPKPTFYEPLLLILLHRGPPEANFCNNFQLQNYEHRWSSGRILACHAGDPGSIPGRCRGFFTSLRFSVLNVARFCCNYVLYNKHHSKRFFRLVGSCLT